jgi:hypothetical protein
MQTDDWNDAVMSWNRDGLDTCIIPRKCVEQYWRECTKKAAGPKTGGLK